MSATKPLIGITLGDYNGIGPEVIIKALSNPQILQWCVPIIYGSQKVLIYYKNTMEARDFQFKKTSDIANLAPDQIYVINCWDDVNTIVEPGKETPEAGKAAEIAPDEETAKNYKKRISKKLFDDSDIEDNYCLFVFENHKRHKKIDFCDESQF
jgi:4-hydroxy-L-threonine phosphate dehydrogenase PdxA